MSLITIEQLLESVDLDFEPRFITKSKTGHIGIWREKPEVRDIYWIGEGIFTVFGKLRISEFDGKDWTECIYEVPQKTTGKIEKLENELMEYTFDGKEYETLKMPSLENFMNKINELVDAVNELKGAKND